MIDISETIQQLWGMFTDLFYLTLQKYDQVVVFHSSAGDPVSLLDFCITLLVLGVVLSVILGIRFSVPSQSDLM